MVTIKEIAERAGASVNTVSRVLNGKLNETWPKVAQRAEMIRALARELGYRPNSAARAMRSRRSRQIGILLSGPYSAPYEYPVVAGINGVLQKAGYTLTVVNASGAGDSTELRAFTESFLEGLFVMHVPEELRSEIEAFSPHRIWVDSWVRKASNCIYRDEEHAGALAAQRVLELGYREFLYVCFKPWENCHPHVFARKNGVFQTLQQAGVPVRAVEMGFELDELPEIEHELLDALHPGVAVVAVSEIPAQWCANVAARRGMSAGKDYALVSCAEALPFQIAWPWLSRVLFDREDMGAQAGNMMLELLGGKKQVKSRIVRNELYPGETALPAARSVRQARQ